VSPDEGSGWQKPIDRAFAELRTKGFIAAKRKLVRKKTTWRHDFKAGILRRWNIYYNEMHSSLKDDLLRFVLLHEEGHFASKQNSTILLGFIIAGFVGLAYFYLVSRFQGHPNGDALILDSVVMAFLSLMSLRAFETPLQEDETRADLHAARVMIEKLGVEKPSVVAESLFEIQDKREHDKTSLSYQVMWFIGGGIHPPTRERIRAIRELEESLAKGADADGDAVL